MFSQNKEEQYILEYFKDKPKGTFLDIGCNDCETFSNTRALALKGWSGVFVDPSQQAIERCKVLYKGFKKQFYIYPVAISKHNGKAILNESGPLIDSRDVALVSTFYESEMLRFRHVVYYPTLVKTFKWKTFYNRLQIKEFDFINIDVEGDELNILPDIDLSKTSLVCVEWNGKQELKAEYDKILQDFKVIYTSGENLVYAR